MTSGHNLRSRIHKDWKKLCFGDSLPRLKKEPAASRVVLEETFKVERLIVKKFTPKEVINKVVSIYWLNFKLDTEALVG